MFMFVFISDQNVIQITDYIQQTFFFQKKKNFLIAGALDTA